MSMQNFIYTYQNAEGVTVKGKIKAESAGQAKAILNNRDIYPLSLKKEQKSLFQQLFSARRIQDDDVVMFTQLFSSCTKTGMTVKESLSLLEKQVGNKSLQTVIEQIRTAVESGTPLSQAFSEHGDHFPEFYPMLIKAGEASGDLPEVLGYLGQYLDRVNTLKKELQGIFIYPIIVTVIGFALLALILVFVAPTFKDVFAQTGSQLPFATVILFSLSEIVSSHSVAIMLGFLGFLIGVQFYYKSEPGRKRLDLWIISAPVIGPILKQVMLLRFLKTFEILVNHNVPILETLKVIEDGTSNVALSNVIREMRHDVAKGLPISGPLLANGHIISPMVSYSVSMGEKSGNLAPTLSRLSEFIDREMGFSMKRLSARLDPALTLGLGTMVLFIALAIYLPIFDMMGSP